MNKPLELKPCPFCGGPADRCTSDHLVNLAGIISHKVMCADCGIGTQWREEKTRAINEWNRRVWRD
jgi:Lar family restriction alleviation protein